MTSRIYPLPTDVVHLIAAGEVIDSLAAVVRELVENALDASADRLTISLWPEQWRVRVADNGVGMTLADLQQAAQPHSTSKIRTCRDLWRINSLGFRGEALHSLSQLAQLEIHSRPQSDPTATGWRVTYDTQGDPVRVENVAIAAGAIVTVSDLFAPWPIRRQGLPSPAQQMRAVQLTIQRLALCHPHITWQVEQNDRPWFTLWPGESAQQTLPQILRDVQPCDLREVVLEAGGAGGDGGDGGDGEDRGAGKEGEGGEENQIQNPKSKIQNPLIQNRFSLLLGLPDRCHRRRPDWVLVALNGRPVQAPELEQVIIGAFRRTLPRDRYPVCFLHLQIAPEQIDWNRHPAKSEIYLHHLDDWRMQIAQAIDQALRLAPESLSEDAHTSRIGQVLKAAEAGGVYSAPRSIQSIQSPAISDRLASVAHSPSPLSASDAPSLRAIAQVHSMYILAEQPAGICLIEQHIAHERVLYEQLCDRWQMVALETPVILQRLSVAQVEQLKRIGLEIDPFGERLWAIRTAPDPLAHRQDCAEALLELSLGGDLQSALVATACRTAIRNGAPLTLPEMQTILNQWRQTRNPRTCPHGRPICLTLEESSLSRFFRRHWVIGKSHGI